MISGKITVGTVISETTNVAGYIVTPETIVTAILTGEGGVGTYTVSTSQTVGLTGMTGMTTGVDFIANGFVPRLEFESVTITSIDGEFSCQAIPNHTFQVGQQITISGTTTMPKINGYVNPTTYKISATNGTNQFKLVTLDDQAIVTVVGATTGLAFTYNNIGTGTALRLGPGPTGLAASDINIDGGGYVDTYSSHAPEELVPGAIFDTLDFRVYTTPGADWDRLGHGFAQNLNRVTYTTATATFSFAGQVPYPFAVELTDETQGYELILDVDYTVNWPNQTVTLLSTSSRVVNNDIIDIYVYGLGGGNQLYKQTYNGATVGNSLVVPIEYKLVYEFAIFVNGVPTTNFTYANNAIATYGTTVITFTDTYTSADFISLVALGKSTPPPPPGVPEYSWSTPLTEVIDAETGTNTYDLTNSLAYTNPVTAVVMLDGERIRTAAGIGYTGDGTTDIFLVAQRLGFDQATITQSDVLVYLDAVLLPTSSYTVQSLTSGTTVEFVGQAPAAGKRIYIAVTTVAQSGPDTGAQAVINPVNSTVRFIGVTPTTGQSIQVTTFNDTREQRLLTQVFVGPVTIGVSESQGYDTTPFDQGNVNDEPGSYDYSFGDTQTVNNIILNRTILDDTRPWVTLNGRKLSPNIDYIIQGNELVLSDAIGILEVTDVVMVTLMSDTVVPEAMEFRIFQDMRGVQATYRMTPATTTTLVQELLADDDIIYVADANALSEPNLPANVWGVLTINGERIMYRERDIVSVPNTVSSLLRGTAGTAAADHSVGTEVFDMGRGNLLDPQQQNYVVETTTVANGTQTVFTAPNITI
jgi:hypothetical protein